MRVFGLLSAFFIFASAALAQTPVIKPEDASKHLGEIVTVEGTVTEVNHPKSGKVIHINMGGHYPNNPYTGTIFARDFDKFPDVDSLTGKTVAITGRLQEYKGELETIVNDPAQIRNKW
jgi:DNA/RNA endonuclease YhcR with UshA esterase domain